MTSTQIENTLSEIGGYELELDIPLSEVKYIYLTTDGCLYPGNDKIFNFHVVNGDDGLLMMYSGRTDENGVFIKDSEIPEAFIDFSVIAGFILY